MSECLFCSSNPSWVIAENTSAYAIRDAFPVTDLHTLIIPRRHVEGYFDLTGDEKIGCEEMLSKSRKQILIEDALVTGFNIGINVGKSAGQTIFHCHIHLIPRRDGDVTDPRGGVRGVIPHKKNY